ncbi:hypothetical protein PAMA_000910 [Pampus argenteus]
MYVLCTMAVLTLHSLFKNRSHKVVEPVGTSEAAGQGCPPGDGVVAERWAEAWGRGGDLVASRAEGKRRRVKSPVEDEDGGQTRVFSSLDIKLTCRPDRISADPERLLQTVALKSRTVAGGSVLLSQPANSQQTASKQPAAAWKQQTAQSVRVWAGQVAATGYLSPVAAGGYFCVDGAGDVSVQHAGLGGNSDQQLVGPRTLRPSCGAQSSLRTWMAGPAVQCSAQPGGHVQLKKDLGPRPRPLPAGALEERRLIGRTQCLSADHRHHTDIKPPLILSDSEHTDPNRASIRQKTVLTLQDKVCEFQARLRSEEIARHLLVQQLHQQSVPEKTSGVQVLQEERLAASGEDAEALRRELSRWESQARQRERRLAELERELLEKTAKLETLQTQLDESTLQLDESRRRQSGAEHKLTLRLQECEEELARQAAMPPKVKYVTQTVEVESANSQKALADVQMKNGALQEQLAVQRQLLRELETQLHESQRTCTQLRTQLLSDQGRLCGLLSKAVGRDNGEVVGRLSKILVYEGEMERAQGQLEAEMQNLEEEKNRVIEEAFIRAESEMKAVHENLAGVRMNLLSLQPALRTLTCDYNCLKRQVQEFPFMLDKAITEAKQERLAECHRVDIQTEREENFSLYSSPLLCQLFFSKFRRYEPCFVCVCQICQVISEVSSTNQELLRKYKREMNLRKKCHNELVRLKGNIRVFCRVRPVSQEEQDSADAKTMLSFDSDDDAILYLSNKGKVMTFELDKVFPPQATQEEVFQEVQSLVTSCIDGFNICIFAYGQTGSGKTYTMEGVVDDPGINQRALRLLFSEVTEKAPDWDYKITVSMVEIYNETLRNLLGENPTDKLDIKMNPDGSGQLYVPGLTEFTVQSPEDINRLNLVDLAGSERIGKSGAEGSRLREAQCINKSLSALGDVINALRSKHSHVPFRNSRLTYLLQDSLSGDSKTLMMVQVSPLPNNMSESVCSLKFAQRVRSVELNSTSSSSRRHENSSTSSSPTHDSVELDSPPVTPVPLPISRASSAGSTLSSTSRTPSSSRRRSQSQLSTDRQVDRTSPLVGDGGQVGGGVC